MTASVAAAPPTVYTEPMLLEHLLDFNTRDFLDIDTMDTTALLDAQAETAGDFLSELGSPEHLLAEDQVGAARSAFAAVTNTRVTEKDKKAALLTLRVPEAVKHLAGMLSQYDWDYVEQAKELRGYVVAQLLEESKHPDARIRLAALKALGSVTEVGAFTERIEVVKRDMTSTELEDRIRAKLKSLLPKTVEIETVQPKPQPD
jgi:hypothetical protein